MSNAQTRAITASPYDPETILHTMEDAQRYLAARGMSYHIQTMRRFAKKGRWPTVKAHAKARRHMIRESTLNAILDGEL